MSTVVALEDLGTSGLTIYGHVAGDQAGFSVSDVGDINNDGYDDYVIGAPGAPFVGHRGSAYLIYGGPTEIGEVDLRNLASAHGFRIDGSDWNQVGISVAGAGDVNGDGFADLLAAASNFEGGLWYAYHAPSAYVIYGGESRTEAIDVTSLSASDGFEMTTPSDWGFVSVSASEAGDINNDGFDDVIVGLTSSYGSNNVAYVVYGREGGYANVDLTNLGASGFVISAPPQNYPLGIAVSAAGDINGDHFADIIIGTPRNNASGNLPGAAYVIFGHEGNFGTVDLTAANFSGIVIQSSDPGDMTGVSVSSADFNGDGYSDLIVGAPGTGGPGNGQAYVIFGHGGAFPAIIDPSNLGGAGFVIQGQTSELLGFDVSGAGDVNGDGFEDLIVSGGYSNDIYLLYGHDGPFGTVDLTNLQPSAGMVFHGPSLDEGWQVSGARDINDDGLADILIGARGNDHNGQDAGAVYVIFGQASAIPDVRNDFNGDGFSDLLWRNDDGRVVTLLGAQNRSFIGNVNFDLNPGLDWHIEGTGDFNGDGNDDILWRNDLGTVVTLLGQANGAFVGNVSFNLNPGLDWHVEGTGDFNGDHFDDVLWRNDAGTVVTLLGEAGGSFIGNVAFNLNPGLDWHVEGTGDFNGDGLDDILWRNDLGNVVTLLGHPNGSFVGNVNFALNPGLDWHIIGAGDFNGDGMDDILWRNDAGTITDLLGQHDGSFIGNVANLNVNPGLDWQIAGIGDYNGDGRDDIVLRDSAGNTIDWLGLANGAFVDNSAVFSLNPGLDWQVQPELALL